MRPAYVSRAGRARAARAPRNQGLVFVYVALLGLLLVGAVGLALDTALVASATQQLQYAADAAALAAVQNLETDVERRPEPDYSVTRVVAADMARRNRACGAAVQLDLNASNDAAGDIVVGLWNEKDGTFTPNLENPNAVRVQARRSRSSLGGPLDLVFGPVFGALCSEIGVSATATFGLEARPVILVLDPSGAGALRLTGDPRLAVPTGMVQVNSTNPCAIELTGMARLSAIKIATTGGICAAPGQIEGVIDMGEPEVGDPLARELPDVAAWEGFKSSLALPLGRRGTIAASGSFAPGFYPGGLLLSDSAEVTLQPGFYVLGGAGLSVQGNATLSGTRVVVLIDRGGQVDVRGSANLLLTAPGGRPGSLEGVALFSHRENTGLAVSLGGTGQVRIRGTVYVPSGLFRMAGGPDHELASLVTYRMENVGAASLSTAGTWKVQNRSAAYLVE